MTDTTGPAAAADTPAPSLAPKVEPAPNGRFFMAVDDWQVIQCYVEGGTRLPISKDEAITKLNISPEDADHFHDMWEAYSNVHDHCHDFQFNVFPQTVSLASDIVDYGRAKVPTYYGGLTRILDRVDQGTLTPALATQKIQAILTNLTADAQDRADKAEAAMKSIAGFIEQTQQDKGFLEPIQDRYKQEYEGESGIIAQFTQEVEDDKNLIETFNDEYRKDVTIACTSATYAWIFPCGTIAAGVVAGVYGKRAQDALDHVHEYQDKLAATEVKLRAAILLKHDLDLANTSLDGIVEKLNAALPVLAKAKGIWSALTDDIKQVLVTIAQDISKAPLIIASLGVDEAIIQWKAIADEADQYRVNAFITIKSEDAIKSDPQHAEPVAAPIAA
jgi:hypothetical protein